MVPGLLERNYELWIENGKPHEVRCFFNRTPVGKFNIESFKEDFQKGALEFTQKHIETYPSVIPFSYSEEGIFKLEKHKEEKFT